MTPTDAEGDIGGAEDFSYWTNGRVVENFGTNAGHSPLPIQSWRHFKEAFAPEVVHAAMRSSKDTVRTVLDPFGGSGTAGLAAQFLGARPTVVEVNPYLADVIEAKLSTHDATAVVSALDYVLLAARDGGPKASDGLPETFLPPGRQGRYLFHEEIGRHLLAVIAAIDAVPEQESRLLLRVLLSSLLVPSSNARVSGKGRRYRANWRSRVVSVDTFNTQFRDLVSRAATEIVDQSGHRLSDFTLIRGDARTADYAEPGSIDLAVTSPPYPNSFDYTDVYNIELWMLGYLKNFNDNRVLRESTLDSHVQLLRKTRSTPVGSPTLDATVERLTEQQDQLWNPSIPAMVGNYFSDLTQVCSSVALSLKAGAPFWLIVGDSQYSKTHIRVPEILGELVPRLGFEHVRTERIREMRSAPQQGGAESLPESLVVFRRL